MQNNDKLTSDRGAAPLCSLSFGPLVEQSDSLISVFGQLSVSSMLASSYQEPSAAFHGDLDAVAAGDFQCSHCGHTHHADRVTTVLLEIKLSDYDLISWHSGSCGVLIWQFGMCTWVSQSMYYR